MEENIEEIFAEEEDKVLNKPELNIFDKFGFGYQFCFELIINYGWYMVILAVVVYYLYQKYKSIIDQYLFSRSSNESRTTHSQNPEEILARQEGMEASRRKMQERLNKLVEEEHEKQKQREEIKRKEKIEEWERFQAGGSFRSRNRLGTGDDTTEPSSSSNKKVGKDAKSGKSLRGEFNPLLGPSGGASYRPSRRGMSGGG